MIRALLRYVVAPLTFFIIGCVAIFLAWTHVSGIPSLFLMPSFDDWESYAVLGDRIGPASAPVTAFVFSDYECPRSLELWGRLDKLREAYPSELTLVYRHFPLQGMGSSGAEAARAAVCASRQVEFEAIHRELFAQAEEQVWLPWATLAQRAGVSDSAAFDSCMSDPRSAARVARDLRAAQQLRAHGAPLLYLNGARFNGAVDAKHLREFVDQLVQAKARTP